MAEEVKADAALEQPTSMPSWWSRNKKYWIPALILLVVVIVLVAVLAGETNVSVNDSYGNNWKLQKVDLDFQPEFVKLTGTWNDRMVVGGQIADRGAFKDYQVNSNNRNEWLENGSFVLEDKIESIDVSETGSRIAIAFSNPVRVQVFDRDEDVWTQYGEIIDMSNLGVTGSNLGRPSVVLSSNGKTLALGIPNEKVHVFEDVNSLGGTIGGNWRFLGEPLDNLHDEDHGQFATYISLSGDGRKLAVASEIRTLSVHRLNVEDKWGLFAEYDESPMIGNGSLEFSRDGNTIAVGGYDGQLQGTGELHVINDSLTWYLKNESQVQNAHIEVALSADGNYVLLGRFPETGKATLQVFQFNKYENEWMDRGNFGNFVGQTGDIDMSDDGRRVAAVSDNKLYVFENQGW